MDPGRIRNVGFHNKAVAGKGDSVLWDGQKDAGRGRRPYALCHLLWDWVGICLETPGSGTGVLRPCIPLSPECFVADNISLTYMLVGNAESRASLYRLSQNLHFTEIPSGILLQLKEPGIWSHKTRLGFSVVSLTM